ncbi:ABC transporter ATP-binding protein [Piscicoccus intestinalis]|uniref:ABC transporter ATP-binding protein n=1 Tax=Piscicoccus intestinalis TaxID=746033 RepID=UPI000837F286|nr:ABC transporter ATP-binding protein [Piscicoccus intestinalis]
MSAALELTGIGVVLRGRPVLTGLDLRVTPGECRALVGLNGAGKTTALRVSLGMLPPGTGRARLLGHDLARAPRALWSRVGHLVETPACYPELTARENLECGARLRGVEMDRWRPVAMRMARDLDLGRWLDTPVRRLSLGTRQKVGLVGALAHGPALAVLDEPTNGLDPLAVVAFRNLLGEATASGGAVLVTSHHFDELARVADRVDVLHRGRVVDSLTPDGRDLERTFFATILAADRATAGRP